MKNRIVALVCIAALVACQDLTEPTPPVFRSESPEQGPSDSLPEKPDFIPGPPNIVPGRFIVTLVEGTRPDEVAREHGLEPDFVYSHVLNGFAGSIAEAARSGLLRDNRVTRIEHDVMVSATDDGVQGSAPWALDRIDQKALPLNGGYTYESNGSGVRIFIVDSGIRYSHAEFEGRAVPGFDAWNVGGEDCYGHGTHVAGIAAGKTYGVAKGATLVNVRVLNCAGSGMASYIAAGLDWILANYAPPGVANFSLATSGTFALTAAMERFNAAGFIGVAAAGNSNVDACTFYPASSPYVIGVGSSDRSDKRSSFSNWGECVDLFAPGSSITSSYHSSNTATSSMSGTSMASPHVAGAVALFLSQHPTATPSEVAASLMERSTKNVVTDSKSANNDLVFSLGNGTGSELPVTAAFGHACEVLSCSFTDQSAGPVATYLWSFGDGSTSSERSPTHAYAVSGTYSVRLTVSDAEGQSSTIERAVLLQGSPAPTADFTVSCLYLDCTFLDGSAGPVESYSWSFGDESTSSVPSPNHSYTAPGSYTVRLTVTASDGQTSTKQKSITVEPVPPPPPPIALQAVNVRPKGYVEVILTWSGATTSSVDVFRNGQKVRTVADTGTYSDVPVIKGKSAFVYKVCEAGSTVCSADVMAK